MVPNIWLSQLFVILYYLNGLRGSQQPFISAHGASVNPALLTTGVEYAMTIGDRHA